MTFDEWFERHTCIDAVTQGYRDLRAELLYSPETTPQKRAREIDITLYPYWMWLLSVYLLLQPNPRLTPPALTTDIGQQHLMDAYREIERIFYTQSMMGSGVAAHDDTIPYHRRRLQAVVMSTLIPTENGLCN
jgi:hypothetical protein